jgi:hypothetical protein
VLAQRAVVERTEMPYGFTRRIAATRDDLV